MCAMIGRGSYWTRKDAHTSMRVFLFPGLVWLGKVGLGAVGSGTVRYGTLCR